MVEHDIAAQLTNRLLWDQATSGRAGDRYLLRVPFRLELSDRAAAAVTQHAKKLFREVLDDVEVSAQHGHLVVVSATLFDTEPEAIRMAGEMALERGAWDMKRERDFDQSTAAQWMARLRADGSTSQ